MMALAFRHRAGLLLLCMVAALGCRGGSVEPESALTGVALGELWKQRMRLETNDSVLVVAHRGFACCFPENTTEAMRGARALGSDGVEVDVRLTADGEPILMHDATVDRTTDGSGEVRRFKLSDIRTLDACSWFGRRWRKCLVPTLYEAFAATAADQWIILELKRPFPDEAVRRVLELVHELGIEHRTSIMSFDLAVLQTARNLSQEVSVIHLVANTGQLDALSALGNAMVMFHKDTVLARPQVVRAARDRGLVVGAYTVRKAAEARALIAAGVRVLLSDFPFGRIEPPSGPASGSRAVPKQILPAPDRPPRSVSPPRRRRGRGGLPSSRRRGARPGMPRASINGRRPARPATTGVLRCGR